MTGIFIKKTSLLQLQQGYVAIIIVFVYLFPGFLPVLFFR